MPGAQQLAAQFVQVNLEALEIEKVRFEKFDCQKNRIYFAKIGFIFLNKIYASSDSFNTLRWLTFSTSPSLCSVENWASESSPILLIQPIDRKFFNP